MIAAIRFRDTVYRAEFHSDALEDCICDLRWPESQQELASIIDNETERVEFGRMSGKVFLPFRDLDQRVRQEWYIQEGAR